MLRDIRDHLPKTAQTDPNKFPAYEYRPYPRMMKDEKGKPRLGPSGNPVVVNSAEEERAFLGKDEAPHAASVEIDTDEPATLQSIAPESLAEKPRRGRPPNAAKLPADLTS